MFLKTFLVMYEEETKIVNSSLLADSQNLEKLNYLILSFSS